MPFLSDATTQNFPLSTGSMKLSVSRRDFTSDSVARFGDPALTEVQYWHKTGSSLPKCTVFGVHFENDNTALNWKCSQYVCNGHFYSEGLLLKEFALSCLKRWDESIGRSFVPNHGRFLSDVFFFWLEFRFA